MYKYEKMRQCRLHFPVEIVFPIISLWEKECLGRRMDVCVFSLGCLCADLAHLDNAVLALSIPMAARLASLSNPLWPTLAVTHHHQLDVWEFITSLDGVLGDVFWLGVLVGLCLSQSACHKAIFMIPHAILSVRSACFSQGDRLCFSVQACASQLMEAILCSVLWDRKYCGVFCGRKLLLCFTAVCGSDIPYICVAFKIHEFPENVKI